MNDVATAAKLEFVNQPQRAWLQQSRLRWSPKELLTLFLICAFWVATRPYVGVVHDARLYLVQALNGLHPSLYGNDLYLKYGSQDSFTVFSLAYKPLIAALGPPNAHFVGAIIGQAAWLCGLLYLLRSLYKDEKTFLFAALAAIGMQSGYAGLDVFHYGEAFVTPRLFAEALVLLSLGAALRTRLVSCAILLLAAFALHPLMALSGAGALFMLAVFHDRRAWLLAAAGALALLCLAEAEIGPFGRLLLRYDPHWWATVHDRCIFALITRWRSGDFLRLASTFAVLITAISTAEARERRLLAAVTTTAGVATLGSYLGTDVAHNVFFTNLQAWRALWLTSLMANVCIGAFIARRATGPVARELFLGGALISAASQFIFAPLPMTAAVTLTASAAAYLEGRRASATSAVLRQILRIPLAVAILWIAFACFIRFRSEFAGSTAVRLLCELAAITGLVICTQARKRRAIAVLAAILLGLAPFLHVDQRSAWTKYVENEDQQPELHQFIANTGNLYWEGGLELLWIKGTTPSYYSCAQGSGSMFYKDTADEYSRRSAALSILNSTDFANNDDGLCWLKRNPGFMSSATASDVRATCRTLPDLDTIVLSRPVYGLRAESWSPSTPQPVEISDGHARYAGRYYKYRCSSMR